MDLRTSARKEPAPCHSLGNRRISRRTSSIVASSAHIGSPVSRLPCRVTITPSQKHRCVESGRGGHNPNSRSDQAARAAAARRNAHGGGEDSPAKRTWASSSGCRLLLQPAIVG